MGYLTVKISRLLLALFIIITVNFAVPRLMPGNPVLMNLGQDAVALSGEDFAQLEKQYGLDKPLALQYFDYLRSLSDGRLGFSYHHRRIVEELIGEHLSWTLVMLVPAVLISAALAVAAGCFAGWRAGSGQDMILTLGALLVYAMPQFLLAMLFLAFFGFKLGVFPLGGLHSGAADTFLEELLDILRHLALPVAVLALSYTPAKFLIVRNSVAAARNQGYVLYARARGMGQGKILFVHVLKNACLPFVAMTALNFGFIVSGALLVEIVFSINGMGSLIYEAAAYRDYPVLQGCFLVLTVFVVAANALADVIISILDPRTGA